MTTTPREAPICIFGQWTVYEDCVECERAAYCVTLEELERRGVDWWDAHMAGKRWVNRRQWQAARARLLGEGTR